MRRRLRAGTELQGIRDLALFPLVAAFAAGVPLLMRLPLPLIASLLDLPPRTRVPAPGEVERLDRIVSLAPRIAAPLVRSGCLTRGVTLFWFLRWAGLDVELCFGLDPGGEQETDGHCWLALHGEPFLEKRDPRPRFAEVYRLPLATAA